MTVRECGLTGVQLHFDAAPELPAKLRCGWERGSGFCGWCILAWGLASWRRRWRRTRM